MPLPWALMLVASGTTAADLPRFTVTSTVYGTVIVGDKKAPSIAIPSKAPKKKPAPITIEEPAREFGGETFFLGFGAEMGLFRSRALAFEMSAISPQQEAVPSDLARESVIVLALVGQAELRPLRWFGIAGELGYYFTPRFFSVSFTDEVGEVKTALAFAHGLELGAEASFYLELSRNWDLRLSFEPAIYGAHTKAGLAYGPGARWQLGLNFVSPDLPQARLSLYVRYAPLTAGEDALGLDLSLSGGGMAADVAFAVF